jgi:acetyltransferase-like isoleucine patch superfamily enzyme
MIKKILRMLFEPSLFIVEFKRRKLEKKFNENQVTIGYNCSVYNSKLGFKVFLSNNSLISNSEIGNYSYVNANSNISKCTIGKFCSIASSVQIGIGIHPTHLVSTHPAFYANNKDFETFADKNHFEEYKKVIIGNDVWIGNGVTIMGGVCIGDGAVIAANAVVTKNVEPYSIAGGVPARHIKFRFDENFVKKISKIAWWNNSHEWFKENYMLFHNPEQFISFFENEVK